MQLEQPSTAVDWNGAVPVALDWRVVGLVLGLSALAASLNVPNAGIPFALAAFGLLAGGGVVGHVLGERRLRRITTELVERWGAEGTQIEDVTRSGGVTGTAWTVHTADGPVTVKGFALAPLSKVSVEWQGTSDVHGARDVENRLDGLAAEWHREFFELN